MSRPDLGLKPATVCQLIDIIASFKEIEMAAVFGSRAKGSYKPGSDVDLLVDGLAVDYRVVARLSNALNEESTLPYYFDVIARKTIRSDALLKHIEEFGIEVYKQTAEQI